MKRFLAWSHSAECDRVMVAFAVGFMFGVGVTAMRFVDYFCSKI